MDRSTRHLGRQCPAHQNRHANLHRAVVGAHHRTVGLCIPAQTGPVAHSALRQFRMAVRHGGTASGHTDRECHRVRHRLRAHWYSGQLSAALAGAPTLYDLCSADPGRGAFAFGGGQHHHRGCVHGTDPAALHRLTPCRYLRGLHAHRHHPFLYLRATAPHVRGTDSGAGDQDERQMVKGERRTGEGMAHSRYHSAVRSVPAPFAFSLSPFAIIRLQPQ